MKNPIARVVLSAALLVGAVAVVANAEEGQPQAATVAADFAALKSSGPQASDDAFGRMQHNSAGFGSDGRLADREASRLAVDDDAVGRLSLAAGPNGGICFDHEAPKQYRAIVGSSSACTESLGAEGIALGLVRTAGRVFVRGAASDKVSAIRVILESGEQLTVTLKDNAFFREVPASELVVQVVSVHPDGTHHTIDVPRDTLVGTPAPANGA